MKAAEFQRLVAHLGELTPEQRRALGEALLGEGDATETMAVIEARFAEKGLCPHCQGEAQK